MTKDDEIFLTVSNIDGTEDVSYTEEQYIEIFGQEAHDELVELDNQLKNSVTAEVKERLDNHSE